MQQEIIVNRIIKLIEEKQKNCEFGTIVISFQNGLINDIDDTRKRKINVNEK